MTNIIQTLKNKKKKAFTLVEILIVVAIIGILFVALIPKMDIAGEKARETGVKTDFRAFSLASEQLLRENAGISKFSTLTSLCESIDSYLDKALQFNSVGEAAKKDPWNQSYTMQIILPEDGNENNGCIVVVCNGKDSKLDTDLDNYAIATVFIDNAIESATTGFSSNIKAAKIDTISADDTSESMTISSGVATIKYKK